MSEVGASVGVLQPTVPLGRPVAAPPRTAPLLATRAGPASSPARRSPDPSPGPATASPHDAAASRGPATASPPEPGPERPRKLRLFVALDLPEPARDALAALGAAADPDAWRPVARQALHVTLAFLGARPPDDVDRIAPIVAAEAGGPAPALALGAVLLLPPRRARVLTVELDDRTDALAALQARMSTQLAEAGVYTAEKRPFRAHVTIGRLRPRARPPRTVALDPPPLRFPGAAVTLYVSRLHPTGARYEPLASAPLDAS